MILCAFCRRGQTKLSKQERNFDFPPEFLKIGKSISKIYIRRFISTNINQEKENFLKAFFWPYLGHFLTAKNSTRRQYRIYGYCISLVDRALFL